MQDKHGGRVLLTGFRSLWRTVSGARGLLHNDRSIYALVGLHALVGCIALYATDATNAFAHLAYLPTWPLVFFAFFPFMYFLVGVSRIIHRFDTRRRLAFRKMLAYERCKHFFAGLALLAAMMLFQGTCTSLKNAFPTWHGGFPNDILQADLDEYLHFGEAPWRYLMTAGDNGVLRWLIEWNYNQGWFIFCFSALFWVAVSVEANRVRTRYFLCYCLNWIIIGNVFAFIFLSAGPAFYGQVAGDVGRFADQMAFLGESNSAHSAVNIQRYLLALYEAGQAGFGSGISAFPSMHVSLAMLNALFLFEWSRKWGCIALGYVLLVLASSVYLAWHYAIDGYAAILLTTAIYWLVRKGFSRSGMVYPLADARTA